MGLIQCPNCKNEISDKALTCPKCSYTFKDDNSTQEIITETDTQQYIATNTPEIESKKKLYIKIILIVIISVFSICLLCAMIIGLKHQVEKHKAQQLDIIISSTIGKVVWKSSSYIDSDYLSPMAQEALTDREKSSKYLDQLYEYQNQYNEMTDYQKQYVKAYKTLEEAIDFFETKKAMYELSDKMDKVLSGLSGGTKEQSNQISQEEQGDTENTFYMEPYTVKLKGAFLSSDNKGNSVIVMEFNFTNSSSEAKAFRSAIHLALYQDGIELEQCYNAKGYDISPGLNTRIRDGASLDVQMAYILRNETSAVDFEMNEWGYYNGAQYQGRLSIR